MYRSTLIEDVAPAWKVTVFGSVSNPGQEISHLQSVCTLVIFSQVIMFALPRSLSGSQTLPRKRMHEQPRISLSR